MCQLFKPKVFASDLCFHLLVQIYICMSYNIVIHTNYAYLVYHFEKLSRIVFVSADPLGVQGRKVYVSGTDDCLQVFSSCMSLYHL